MKKLYVLIYLLFSFQVYAQTSQFEFNDEVIASSFCKTKVPLTNQELVAWTKKLPSEPLAWIQVGNKVFKNEHPELALLYRKLLSKDDTKIRFDVFEKKSIDGKKSWWTQKVRVGDELLVEIPTKSDKVLGTLQEIFGKREGLQLAYILHHYRFNGSPFRYKNVSAFNSDELDALILAAADLPPLHAPAYFDHQMTKFSRGYTRSTYNQNILADTMGGEQINYFDSWSDRSFLMKQATIIHEMAHVTSSIYKDAGDSKEWQQTSRWIAQKDNRLKLESLPLTGYAASAPAEDFAESYTAYLYASDYLKRLFPQKFNFLKKNIFHGEEYGNSSSCDGVVSAKKLAAARDLISKIQISPINMEKATNRAQLICAWGLNLNQCLRQVLADQILETLIIQTQNDMTMSPIERRKNLVRVITISNPMIEDLKINVASLHAKTIAWKIKSRVKYASCDDIAFESQFLFNGDKGQISSGEVLHAKELRNMTQEVCEQTIKESKPPYFKELEIEKMALRVLLGQ